MPTTKEKKKKFNSKSHQTTTLLLRVLRVAPTKGDSGTVSGLLLGWMCTALTWL